MIKTIFFRRRLSGLFVILLLVAAVALPISITAAREKDRAKFYKIDELNRLIQKAKEAGFSEKDLETLILRDADKSINVNEYIAEMEHDEKVKIQKLQEFLNKRFLTIGDIYKEMIKLEPDTLINLREELVSDR